MKIHLVRILQQLLPPLPTPGQDWEIFHLYYPHMTPGQSRSLANNVLKLSYCPGVHLDLQVVHFHKLHLQNLGSEFWLEKDNFLTSSCSASWRAGFHRERCQRVCFLSFAGKMGAFGSVLDSRKGVEESLTLAVVQMGVRYQTN